MAEGRVAPVPTPAPPCRLRGAAPASTSGRQCCGGGGGGCGLGLARLVRRLRRRGRRALRSAAAASSQPRRRACQYDPLSYARNFDLGGGGDDAARGYHGCSFSSRFVLVGAVASGATSSLKDGDGDGDVSAGGAAPAAVASG